MLNLRLGCVSSNRINRLGKPNKRSRLNKLSSRNRRTERERCKMLPLPKGAMLQRVLRPLLRAGRQSMPMGRQWVRGSIQRLDPGRFLARFGLFVCCFARKTSPIAVVMVSASRGRVFAWIFGLYPPVGKHKKIKNIFRLQCRSPAGSLSYYAETSVSHSLRCVPLRRQATTPSRKSPVSSASTV